ncbi:(d)CMP kinase [Candidatus Saccharibacteria bacterium]|nr:(d)CMP kinase [Candidatus Saccharibacteria bacterium]MCA9337339.1 (d)CMP kinase [Candidatus Saccharibacteria bacterium]
MTGIDDIADSIKRSKITSGMPIKIVAIDGHGGSGKSTLAVKLAKELDAEVIHTDDFASWDNPTNWWPQLQDQVLEPIKQGAKTLSYKPSSWAPDHYPEPVKDQPVTPIMILEGVSSTRKEFRPYLSYAIWVEAPKGVCIARGLERDGEDMREQWEQWWADEEKYIAEHKPQEYANQIVSGE